VLRSASATLYRTVGAALAWKTFIRSIVVVRLYSDDSLPALRGGSRGDPRPPPRCTVFIKKFILLTKNAYYNMGKEFLHTSETWLRSRTTEDRLSALCLINVYHKVDILDQIDHIIDIFANFKNRQLKFH
jgi:hypothetical protein